MLSDKGLQSRTPVAPFPSGRSYEPDIFRKNEDSAGQDGCQLKLRTAKLMKGLQNTCH